MRRKLTACCKRGAYLLCEPTEVNPEALNFRPFLRPRRPPGCPGPPPRRRPPPPPKTAGRQTPRQSPGVRSPHGPFPPPPSDPDFEVQEEVQESVRAARGSPDRRTRRRQRGATCLAARQAGTLC